MKKIALLFLAFIIFGCDNKNDDYVNYTIELLPIAKVGIIPTQYAVDSITQIPLKYVRPSACYDFNGYYYSKNDFTRTVAIHTYKLEQANCTSLNDSVSVSLNFKPQTTGTYHFKFWKGKDTAGANIFEEYDVVVDH